MARKIIKRRIAADLIDAVFKAEGWTKVEGQSRTRMVKTLYDLSNTRDGFYVATPRADDEAYAPEEDAALKEAWDKA